MNKGTWYAHWGLRIVGAVPHLLEMACTRPGYPTAGPPYSLVFCFALSRGYALTRMAVFQQGGPASAVLGIYSIAAILISTNWFIYVWAVNAGFIVETSLGYFINPLISVLMGVIFLRERLRPGNGARGSGCAGMIYLTSTYGTLPWIALTLAFSWATYGLIKRHPPGIAPPA